ncbi:MAG: signal peptidase I, partial [Eubacterium sp.]|nr:signal peptidase I [Eubacterium sp.]
IFILANAVVPTGSMIPTINEKDRIIASRLSYISNDPERYDIIMFNYPDNEDTKFVKRILGLPGETIDVVNGKVYITDSRGRESAAEDSFVNPAETPTGTSGPFYIPEQGEEITTDGSYCYAENGMNVGSTSFLSKYCEEKDGRYYVEENLYFCIGDNINVSMDSRAWTNKYVAKSKILGKVIFKYYPKFEKFE